MSSFSLNMRNNNLKSMANLLEIHQMYKIIHTDNQIKGTCKILRIITTFQYFILYYILLIIYYSLALTCHKINVSIYMSYFSELEHCEFHK